MWRKNQREIKTPSLFLHPIFSMMRMKGSVCAFSCVVERNGSITAATSVHHYQVNLDIVVFLFHVFALIVCQSACLCL